MAADHAETGMERRLTTQNMQLHAVFADLKDAIAVLQNAARYPRAAMRPSTTCSR